MSNLSWRDRLFVGSIVAVVALLIFSIIALAGTNFAPACDKNCDSQPVYIWYIPIYFLHYPAGEYPSYTGPATGTYKYYYHSSSSNDEEPSDGEDNGEDKPGVTSPKSPTSPHVTSPSSEPEEPVEEPPEEEGRP
jgi:hypothetical protein